MHDAHFHELRQKIDQLGGLRNRRKILILHADFGAERSEVALMAHNNPLME